MDRNNLEDALALAERGLQVFPLHTVYGDRCDCNRDCGRDAGKHPRTMHGLLDATTDPAVITRWWQQWPAANIGIATGPASGIAVIDVDPRHDGEQTLMNDWFAEGRAFPEGPVAYTGGGGWHYYFKYPPARVPSRNGIAQGIDCKGDGGYVVAPPSHHRSGAQYAWCETGIELPFPNMPHWLREIVTGPPAGEEGSAPPIPDQIPDGKRNETLASLGGSLRRRGLGREIIYRALLSVNTDCSEHPLPVDEVARIAASVSRYEPEEGIVIVSGKTAPGSKGKRESPEATTITMRQLQHEHLPPMRWAVQDMIPVGLALLAGKVKLGKSWLALGLSCAIAEGGIALGTVPVEEGEVLMLCYEDSKRRLQSRGITLLGELAEWPERLELSPIGCWPTREEGGMDAIETWLGLHPNARLVIIDTLQRFRGITNPKDDKDPYSADYNAAAELQALAIRQGCAILVIHHYRKSLAENDWVDQIHGSIGSVAACDCIMGFERKRNTEDAILRVTGRDVRDAEWAMRFDPTKYGWHITSTAEELMVSQEATEFVEVVRQVGGGAPVHYKEIAKHLGKTFNTVFQMGKRLAERGHVLSLGQGLYAPLSIAVNAVKMDPQEPCLDTNRTDYPLTGGVEAAVNGNDPSLTALTGVDRPLTGGLSTDSESDNGRIDSVDRGSENADAVLARRSLARSPDLPCGTCGGTTWLPRALGGWVCGTCKPWVRREDGTG